MGLNWRRNQANVSPIWNCSLGIYLLILDIAKAFLAKALTEADQNRFAISMVPICREKLFYSNCLPE